MMQKLINALAVASFVVSGAVVGGGIYVYNQRDAITDNIKSQILGAVQDMMSGSLVSGDALGGLPTGGSSGGGLPVPNPVVPF